MNQNESLLEAELKQRIPDWIKVTSTLGTSGSQRLVKEIQTFIDNITEYETSAKEFYEQILKKTLEDRNDIDSTLVSRVVEYREKLIEYDNKINDLRKELKQKEDQLLRNVRQSKTRGDAELEKEVQKLQRQCYTHDQIKQECELLKKQYEIQGSTNDAQILQLTKTVEELRNSNAKLRETFQDNVDALKKCHETIDSYKELIDATVQQKTLSNKKKTIQDMITEKRRKLEELKSSVASLEQEKKTIEQDIYATELRIKELQPEINKLNLQNTDKIKEIQENNLILNAQQQRLKDAQAQFEMLENRIAENKRELESLQVQSQSNRVTSQQTRMEIDELSSNAQLNESRVKRLKDLLNSVVYKNVIPAPVIEANLNEFDKNMSLIEHYLSMYDQLAGSVIALLKDVNIAKEQSTILEQLTAFRSAHSSLEAALAAAEEERDSLRSQLEATKTAYDTCMTGREENDKLLRDIITTIHPEYYSDPDNLKTNRELIEPLILSLAAIRKSNHLLRPLWTIYSQGSEDNDAKIVKDFLKNVSGFRYSYAMENTTPMGDEEGVPQINATAISNLLSTVGGGLSLINTSHLQQNEATTLKAQNKGQKPTSRKPYESSLAPTTLSKKNQRRLNKKEAANQQEASKETAENQQAVPKKPAKQRLTKKQKELMERQAELKKQQADLEKAELKKQQASEGADLKKQQADLEEAVNEDQTASSVKDDGEEDEEEVLGPQKSSRRVRLLEDDESVDTISNKKEIPLVLSNFAPVDTGVNPTPEEVQKSLNAIKLAQQKRKEEKERLEAEAREEESERLKAEGRVDDGVERLGTVIPSGEVTNPTQSVPQVKEPMDTRDSYQLKNTRKEELLQDSKERTEQFRKDAAEGKKYDKILAERGKDWRKSKDYAKEAAARKTKAKESARKGDYDPNNPLESSDDE